MDCTNLLHQLKISMIDAIPWQRIDNSMPRRYIKQGRKKIKEWWKARVKPKLLPPPRESGFVSSGDISPSPLIVRHSWCSPTATTQQARWAVHHRYHEWHEPHDSRRAFACCRHLSGRDSDDCPLCSVAHLCTEYLIHSPEPLMCDGTRDRPPPLLVAAAWWRNRPSRVDAHRTSAVAVDGTINLVRTMGDDAHTMVAHCCELTARTTPIARTYGHARVSFLSCAITPHRKSKGKKSKTRAFIYGSWASRVIGRQRLSLFLARGMRATRSMSAG